MHMIGKSVEGGMYRIIWLHNQRDLKKKERKKERKTGERERERERERLYLCMQYITYQAKGPAVLTSGFMLVRLRPSKEGRWRKASSMLTINVHSQGLSVSDQLPGALPAMYMSSTYKIVDSIANMQVKRRKGRIN